jgi:predicted dehydrogenase
MSMMPKQNSASDVVRATVNTPRINRRHFIYTSALMAASVATSLTPASAAPNYKSPNEKLDLGCIGVGGSRGAQDVDGVSTENIVALCDVDANMLAQARQKFPNARTYSDYRVMLEKEKSIDGVTVTVPDHHHAPAAMRAIKAGKHVYVEKPLTHTIWEARALRLAAAEQGVVTQMGNQGHSGEGVRRLCEMIWDGAIGDVGEVHCWTDRAKGWWGQGMVRPPGSDPVPSELDWNTWLGPAPERPFVKNWPDDVKVRFAKDKLGRATVYHPAAWRGWWDFGCGALGDMACHIVDCPDWALKLGQPASVEVVSASDLVPEMPPLSAILKYQFPARGALPPVTLTWYDSGQKPPKPPEMEGELGGELASGMLFVGSKGKIIAGVYGANPKLLPESSMLDYKRPDPTIPRVPENSPHQDWIRACKGGPKPCSNFDVSGPLTEWVLLGNIALRTRRKIEWDETNLAIKNDPEAQAMITKKYRPGWEV